MKSRLIILFSTLFIVNFSFGSTINVPSDYTTIQAGIDASTDGDSILVSSGTYFLSNKTTQILSTRLLP